MQKFIPMVVVAACIATAAIASIRQPAAAVVSHQHAVVDTVIPQDTTPVPMQDQVPMQDTAPTVDTSTTSTDTSGISY